MKPVKLKLRDLFMGAVAGVSTAAAITALSVVHAIPFGMGEAALGFLLGGITGLGIGAFTGRATAYGFAFLRDAKHGDNNRPSLAP